MEEEDNQLYTSDCRHPPMEVLTLALAFGDYEGAGHGGQREDLSRGTYPCHLVRTRGQDTGESVSIFRGVLTLALGAYEGAGHGGQREDL